jgi:hypothetical protein
LGNVAMSIGLMSLAANRNQPAAPIFPSASDAGDVGQRG